MWGDLSEVYMRYFVGFLITLGLIIVLILLIFGGGGGNKTKSPTAKTLVSFANTDAEARMIIDGPITADQTHRQEQFIVTRDEVTYKQITGYEHTVVKSPSYENNQAAFDNFLHALVHAGFTKGNPDKALSDERGHCPLGNRYIFEFVQNGKTYERFWTTSCGKPRTYLGNFDLTLSLFKTQVPDYNTQSSDFGLSL